MSRSRNGKLLRGFAAMDPEKLREISSKAGKASQATGKANRFRADGNASAAGRRGGIASGLMRGKKKAASREHDQPETPPPSNCGRTTAESQP